MRRQIALTSLLVVLSLNIVASSSSAGDVIDAREAAPRTEVEKAFILDQMRLLLASVVEIEHGLGTGDMSLVAREAAARGRKANATLARPPTLSVKESDTWKAMFASVRGGFDQVADMANAHAPAAQINQTLADTMRNCVACHQTYRITSETR